MKAFQLHTIETAPEASHSDLEDTQKGTGFIPNLYSVLAEAPTALKAYIQVTDLLDQHSALSAAERHLVAIAISGSNRCGYCMAAHGTVAKMSKAQEEDIQAGLTGKSPDDAKLSALLRFSTALADSKGRLSEETLTEFYDAGYNQRHVLEVITVAALKTLSNYTNHLAETPIDDAFAAYTPPADRVD